MAWYVVGLLLLIHVLCYADRMALAVLLPAIKKTFSLSDTQLGLLSGIAFSISYALAGVPLARLADRHSRRAILGIAVVGWSVMTASMGVAQSFWQLFTSRVGIGLGEAGCVPPCHSMIVDLVPKSRRSAVLGVYMAGAPLGSLVGLTMGSWLGALLGWRQTFQVFGASGIVLAAVFLLSTTEPQRSSAALQGMALRHSFLTSTRKLLSRRAYAYTLIGLGFSGFAQTGLLQWLPSYFIRTFGHETSNVGGYFGIAYGAGAVVGILAGGVVGDRLCAKDARWALWIAIGAYACSLPLMLLAIYSSDLRIAMAATFFGFAILCTPYAPVYAMLQAVSPPHLRALAVAITLLAINLVGAGLGPVLIGFVSDFAAAHAAENPLRFGVLSAIAFFPFPAICYLLANPHVIANARAALSEDDRL